MHSVYLYGNVLVMEKLDGTKLLDAFKVEQKKMADEQGKTLEEFEREMVSNLEMIYSVVFACNYSFYSQQSIHYSDNAVNVKHRR